MSRQITTYEDIPPEDKLNCNDAEGCDSCEHAEVCFGDPQYNDGDHAHDIAREEE